LTSDTVSTTEWRTNLGNDVAYYSAIQKMYVLSDKRTAYANQFLFFPTYCLLKKDKQLCSVTLRSHQSMPWFHTGRNKHVGEDVISLLLTQQRA